MGRMGKRKINRAMVHFKGFTTASAQMLNTPPSSLHLQGMIDSQASYFQRTSYCGGEKRDKGINQQERFREESMNA